MEPTIRWHDSFWVMGMEIHADPMTVDYPAFWGQLGPRLGAIAPMAIEATAYGVYFPCADGLCDVFGGMPVRPDAVPPPGLIKREVPAGEYAVFECAMPDIGATWQAIYSQWLPASGYQTEPQRPCFETFDEGCHEGRVPVRIWTAVKKAG